MANPFHSISLWPSFFSRIQLPLIVLWTCGWKFEYRFNYSKGKTPLQVAIDLNIGQAQTTEKLPKNSTYRTRRIDSSNQRVSQKTRQELCSEKYVASNNAY